MVGVVDLNHLKVELLNDLPIKGFESHSVGIISQAKVFFLSNDIFKELFLDRLALLFHSLLLFKLMSVLALNKLKDGGLFFFILSSRICNTRLL